MREQPFSRNRTQAKSSDTIQILRWKSTFDQLVDTAITNVQEYIVEKQARV
jgi:hypothetical protein